MFRLPFCIIVSPRSDSANFTLRCLPSASGWGGMSQVSMCVFLCLFGVFLLCVSVSLFVRGVGHESGDLCCVPLQPQPNLEPSACRAATQDTPCELTHSPRIHPCVLTHSPRIHPSDHSSSKEPRIHLLWIPIFALSLAFIS